MHMATSTATPGKQPCIMNEHRTSNKKRKSADQSAPTQYEKLSIEKKAMVYAKVIQILSVQTSLERNIVNKARTLHAK